MVSYVFHVLPSFFCIFIHIFHIPSHHICGSFMVYRYFFFNLLFCESIISFLRIIFKNITLRWREWGGATITIQFVDVIMFYLSFIYEAMLLSNVGFFYNHWLLSTFRKSTINFSLEPSFILLHIGATFLCHFSMYQCPIPQIRPRWEHWVFSTRPCLGYGTLTLCHSRYFLLIFVVEWWDEH